MLILASPRWMAYLEHATCIISRHTAPVAALFFLNMVIAAQPLASQQMDEPTEAKQTQGLFLPEMHNCSPLSFSAGREPSPVFGLYLRDYPQEGTMGRSNTVSYLGWNILGQDTTDGGMWLNFEYDYHGWFEHNMDIRAKNGAFVRRMKSAIDRESGAGVSKSWAFDHITLHHGRTDAGSGNPQIEFSLDPSPDFTRLQVHGQIISVRRMVSRAVTLRAEGVAIIDWEASNVIDLHISGPVELSFRNTLPGQRLILVIRNPDGHSLTWPTTIRWPSDGNVGVNAPLQSVELLALDDIILAGHLRTYRE